MRTTMKRFPLMNGAGSEYLFQDDFAFGGNFSYCMNRPHPCSRTYHQVHMQTMSTAKNPFHSLKISFLSNTTIDALLG
ncbi:MAG: hypothetical protein CM15mP14_1050 [Rhodospirillaceae bacterium]|nr:MAG: hypothetical protein CM15mP14_1050 [Rhodospirillaceae bacterium]